ncbi:MAG: type III deoxyribonuclease, partial [bacterium]|nr:type III deoxyribonuclease [bacterium]
QDIQLIGRGARLCPYKLPKEYTRDEEGMFEEFKRNVETDIFRRKFDRDPYDTGRALETLVYHFVKTGMFLENLQRDLLGEGIINEGVEEKTIRMKKKFLESETYKNGFVLVNKSIPRDKTSDEEIDTTFNKIIKASSYNLRARALSDYEENQAVASQSTKVIRITPEFFSEPIIRKALVAAESGFFRHGNLVEHIVGLKTVDELIEDYLPRYEIKYTYEEGKDIHQLNPEEKLQLLVGVILPEVRKSIDLNMPRIVGSGTFRPVSLSKVFEDEKSIYLMAFPKKDEETGKITHVSSDERARPQTNHENSTLRYDVQSAQWYAYDENYGTSEEKKFVKWLATQIDELHARFAEADIYVIRNELDYWMFSPADGRRFAPDYLLIINDHKNKKMYYQCVIEPKGGHLIEHDAWKEEALIGLENSEVSFDASKEDSRNYRKYLKEVKKRGYQEIKNIGFKFFNTDPRSAEDFALDFQSRLPGPRSSASAGDGYKGRMVTAGAAAGKVKRSASSQKSKKK